MRKFCFSIFFLASTLLLAQAKEPLVFCNPLNIDYEAYGQNARIAADPVIVPFNGKYYLFCSLYKKGAFGYRISDNLVDWKTVSFPKRILDEVLNESGDGMAPGVVAMDGYVYYAILGSRVIIRSNNPENPESWEVYSRKGLTGFDPDYFLDDDGKLYAYFGGCESNVAQLKKEDFTTVGGTQRQITPKTKGVEILEASDYGLYRGKIEYEPHISDWNKVETLDTTRLIRTDPPQVPQFSTKSTDSMQEAAWMTKHNGLYYLQNSNPGTACPWYSDSVWVSDSPLGPFKMPDYGTASMKVGGFINSTGHSCVFQDFSGNWWRVTTMWVGVYAGFERRIGLFPVNFDKENRMLTHTEFGDYPMYIPTKKVKKNQNFLMGWNLLSKNAKVEVSSSHSNPKYAAQNAVDENVRTWWSAKTSEAGEWLSLDLGKTCDIRAIQVNFAEQDIKQDAFDENFEAYKLYSSQNGKDWEIVVDKTQNKKCSPHDFIALKKPLKARYLKVENVHTSKLGKFAIRDVRAFGFCEIPKPAQVQNASAIRDKADGRNITFKWKPVEGVQGYVIYYGVAKDALHLNIQYQNPTAEKLTVSCFNRAAKNYYFRIDAYNEGGVTKGKVQEVK